MEAAEVMLVIEGIELSVARRRPRWEPRRAVPKEISASLLSSAK
jgi:hypothetical protein